MAKAATSPELKQAFEDHLSVTEEQVTRLEEVFRELDMPVRGKHCPGMEGLLEEGKELLGKNEGSPAAIDAALIAAGQKVEHYEISAYGSARAFAELLGHERVAELLEATLDEESETNETLTRIAEESVNPEALKANGSETEDEGMRSENSGRSSAGDRSRQKATSRRR
jgi:ferritin-like metal-binding protein YciE